MRSLQVLLFIVVPLSVVLVSCGGGASFNAGVPPNDQVNQLSDQQVQDVCARLQDYLQTQVFSPTQIQRATCTGIGIVAQNTLPGVTCAESVKDCTAQPPAPAQNVIDCSTANSAWVAGCNATVGQVQDCVNEIAADVSRLYSQLTCSIADDPNWQDRLSGLVGQLQNTSCAALDPGCPFAGFGVDISPTP